MEHDFEPFRARRGLFAGDAAAYEAGRPGYPAEVYDALADRAGLRPGARVVEIGPGTGQATDALLAVGARVTAVELGQAMADRLLANHAGPELDVVVGPFEEVALPAEAFDIVASATAFHWVDPAVGIPRCGDLLRPGGTLALWWTFYGDLSRPDPFHDELHTILMERAPELAFTPGAASAGGEPVPYALDVEARTAEIVADDRFGPVTVETTAWTGVHTASAIRAMFASFSPWLALEDARRADLLDEVERLADERFGGTVRRPYQTALYTAQRRH